MSQNIIIRSSRGLLTNKVNDKNKISIQAYRDFSKSSNQEQVSIQGHRYTKTRGAYAHCLLYASSVFRPGQTSRSQYPFRATIMGIYSLDLIYLQSPAIQVKHQDSDLPAMSPAIQVKHQDSDLPAMGTGITKIDEQSHSVLFISSVESTKIMLHGSGFMSTHPRQLSGSDFHELL
ncbi:hypothetical protein PHYBLDRAFT_142647 [Phycomyces blakesleeanus NRRL 1555(-)]|uniref:Uncharacterized protein n=1 Tax=Phycomyces blakesleeanus (strain ATCC 8743b / DSM 1359 / FGSC 10004 / NBRC 33097 / NRRL 1555) TaxID=763407 RepID=A0A167P2P8_PHYB8|nr:hypothetical protein PHYBLDRAFT_142647 [Phycomyces blakesleeanus NRRL 1555(-)]OAD77134.1 hypothetical protein PHYBLDRAFT_142647 [Phycomyces blakesleeanus NRRL 1555(-)]|eukprot:XP_018295174.1 hypothetical protein PHYBLDRAFT_142647 [Phycomyces blakesleeanus NRRL 1555(-)]